MSSYTNAVRRSLPLGRQRLNAVIGSSGDVIQIEDVVGTLGFARDAASKLLSRWMEQGWLNRVGPGTYVPAVLGAMGDDFALKDPWILVPYVYGPAYLGGWTAAEYWDLTEQLFIDTAVFTTRPVLRKRQMRHGARFEVHHIMERKLFGTESVWRGGQTRVQISDVHRTVVDMLSDPEVGAGMQHTAQCVWNYFNHAQRDDQALLRHADRLGNGAVFKRLGFMCEFLNQGDELAAACEGRLTAGNAKLERGIECPRLITRWRLWVPRDLEAYLPNEY